MNGPLARADAESAAGSPVAVARVDARGVLCPVPIIRLARAAAALPAGSLVEIVSDDPAAEHDIPAWCRLRGHTLLRSGPDHRTAGRAHERPGTTDGTTDGTTGPPAEGTAGPPAAGPEPHAPNPQPGQPLLHLIRLGPPDPPAVRP